MNTMDFHNEQIKEAQHHQTALSPLAIEVHSAMRSGAHGQFRPTSSEHLPQVEISGAGIHESITIGKGNTFTIAAESTCQPGEVVRQFDRSGKLVSADHVQAGMTSHEVFDPRTGKRLTDTISTAVKGGSKVEVEHFDANGKLKYSDTTAPGMTAHTTFNANAKIAVDVERLSGTGSSLPEVRTLRYSPDGSVVINRVFPGHESLNYAAVNHPDMSHSVVNFNRHGGKPNYIATTDSAGNTSYYEINQKTGHLTADQKRLLKPGS